MLLQVVWSLWDLSKLTVCYAGLQGRLEAARWRKHGSIILEVQELTLLCADGMRYVHV
jgi:hypothetical protein